MDINEITLDEAKEYVREYAREYFKEYADMKQETSEKIDVNEKLLKEAKEVLSNKYERVTREFKEYLETNDLTKLTMLNPKYTLSAKEIEQISNKELSLSDFKIDTDITIYSEIDAYPYQNRQSVETMTLRKFAEETLKMIEYANAHINDDDFELGNFVDYYPGCRFFIFPTFVNDRKPEEFEYFIHSDILEGFENYITLQYLVADDYINKYEA